MCIGMNLQGATSENILTLQIDIIENPEIPAEPNFDAKNSWKRRLAGKPELPTEPNFDAQNKQNEKYNGNSKMTAQPNFNAKNSWKSSVSNPK